MPRKVKEFQSGMSFEFFKEKVIYYIFYFPTRSMVLLRADELKSGWPESMKISIKDLREKVANGGCKQIHGRD